MFAFYEKPMKSPFVILVNSVVPLKTKRNSLTQEVKRRLRNCHPDVPKSEVAEVLSKFVQKMKNSGYNQRFREQVINAGVLAHKQDVESNRNDGKKLFRLRKERIAHPAGGTPKMCHLRQI